MDVGLGFGEYVRVQGWQWFWGLGVRLGRRVVYEHCVDEGGHRDSASLAGSSSGREGVSAVHSCGQLGDCCEERGMLTNYDMILDLFSRLI